MRLLSGSDAKATVTGPILTYKQPSINDKRCSIYVLNAMAAIINHLTSDKMVNVQEITATAIEAHQ